MLDKAEGKDLESIEKYIVYLNETLENLKSKSFKVNEVILLETKHKMHSEYIREYNRYLEKLINL